MPKKKLHKWKDIKASRMTPDEIARSAERTRALYEPPPADLRNFLAAYEEAHAAQQRLLQTDEWEAKADCIPGGEPSPTCPMCQAGLAIEQAYDDLSWAAVNALPGLLEQVSEKA